MPETARQKLTRLAQATAQQTAEAVKDRRGWTITKFGRHEGGYFHARVVLNGKPIYLHCQYGSWMVPGTWRGRALLKEPESLGIPLEAKVELVKRMRAQERAERKDADGQDATPDREGLPAGEDAG